jgi:RNA polymerase sigma-70 factor (ECF subfamily)
MDSTSATLLERLHDRNDAAAWGRLVDLYTPLIHSWLRRHGVPDREADDLTQDVLKAVVGHLPTFRHSGRAGAFRSWLRTITVNQVRQSWRAGRGRPGSAGLAAALDQLADPASDLSLVWDREHDEHVLRRLLEMIRPEFRPATWEAFCRQAVGGEPAEAVAADLGLTVNAVLIAKSRVLSRLRQEAAGLVGDERGDF